MAHTKNIGGGDIFQFRNGPLLIRSKIVTGQPLQVAKVQRMLAERGDIDDARRLACLQQGKEEVSEHKAGEIIYREPQFVALSAGPALRSLCPRSDPRIADKDVEPVSFGEHCFSKPPRAGKR